MAESLCLILISDYHLMHPAVPMRRRPDGRRFEHLVDEASCAAHGSFTVLGPVRGRRRPQKESP